MTRLTGILTLFLTLTSFSPAQESDLATVNSYRQRWSEIKLGIETAVNTTQLDSLRNLLDDLELRYSDHARLLDRALYPETFAGSIKELRRLHEGTYEKVLALQNQGTLIANLETSVASLSARLDTLVAERDRLFVELQTNRTDVAALQETVRRLQATIRAKDELLFALVDSMFLPLDKQISLITDVQRDALRGRLEKTGIIGRVYEVTADNIRFIDMTDLQGRDFGAMIDQYDHFAARWVGLRSKMSAVALGTTPMSPGTPGTPGISGTSPAPALMSPVQQVDSALAEWNAKLQRTYWTTLEREFSGKGVVINPFYDAQSFSTSIRDYIEAARNGTKDPTLFAEVVWKERIDKEWKASLTKESMLGASEYAALHGMVMEFSEQEFDFTYIILAGILLMAAVILWAILRSRKVPTPPAQQRPA